jgi:iron(III) transport system ATP-binding protein
VLQRNLIPVQAHGQGQLSCLLGELDASALWVQADGRASDDCCVLVDPHDINVVADGEGEASILGREFLGDAWEYRIRVSDVLVRAHCPIDQEHPPHTRCRLTFRDGARVTLLPLGQALA